MKDKMKKIKLVNFQIDETIYKTTLTKKFMDRKPWEPPNDCKLCSFIPGTILKILVKKGQKVEMGEPMLILEAMKMKNEILADRDVVIKDIHVKVGDKIPNRHLMLEFE